MPFSFSMPSNFLQLLRDVFDAHQQNLNSYSSAEPIQFDHISYAPESLGLHNTLSSKFLNDINQAIKEYNQAKESQTKKMALSKMQMAIEHVELHAPPAVQAQAKLFYEIKNNLFKQIKQALAKEGIVSMVSEKSKDIPIARILSDMSPEKAAFLMSILQQGPEATDNYDFSNIKKELIPPLYEDGDISQEAESWRSFLQTHTIEYLGGWNSKNYKVTNIDPNDADYGTTKILKIDNRLNMPRHAESHLRERLDDVFTPVHMARQLTSINKNNMEISRTMLVTELCASGSLWEHAQATRLNAERNLKDSPQLSRIKSRLQVRKELSKSCCTVMEQMAINFLRIENADCCFPDAKLTNWLIDSQGQVRLADTKSFVFTKNGHYSSEVPGNKNLPILSTPGFKPFEIDKPEFDAGKLHSSLLGHNIFAYLTSRVPSNNISENISNLPPEFKYLFSQLVSEPPESRMSLETAYLKLQEIKFNGLFKEKIEEFRKILGDEKSVLSLESRLQFCLFITQQKNTDNIQNNRWESFGIHSPSAHLEKTIASANSPDDLLNKLNDMIEQYGEDLEKKTQSAKVLIEQIGVIEFDNQKIFPLQKMLGELNSLTIEDGLKLDKLLVRLNSIYAKSNTYKTIYENCSKLIGEITAVPINGKQLDVLLSLQEGQKNPLSNESSAEEIESKLTHLLATEKQIETKLKQIKDSYIRCVELLQLLPEGEASLIKEQIATIEKEATSVNELTSRLDNQVRILENNYLNPYLNRFNELKNKIIAISVNGQPVYSKNDIDKLDKDKSSDEETMQEKKQSLEEKNLILEQLYNTAKRAQEVCGKTTGLIEPLKENNFNDQSCAPIERLQEESTVNSFKDFKGKFQEQLSDRTEQKPTPEESLTPSNQFK